MLQILARKPRTIAWLLVSLLYLQLVLVPIVTKANEARMPYISTATRGNLWKLPKAPERPLQQHSVSNKKTPVSGKKVFTTGPTQPEMQSFQSVNANNLVDLFSGDFSYNIPLLDVGGYPVNLHYQGGVTMEQEASWVGLGWNINPGVISRNMRGLPDDFSGDTIKKTVAIKPNRTYGINIGADADRIT